MEQRQQAGVKVGGLMFLIFVVFIALFSYCKYWSNVCNNPYDMSLIFGKKGSGKTTLLQKLTLQYLKKGWKVYSNVELFGAYKYNFEDFGKIRFPENSLIIVDECSLLISNRDYKEFNKKRYIEEYMRYIRHYRNKMILCSQNFDVDKKARLLCDNLYLLSNYGGFFTIAKKIKQRPKLHSSNDESKNDNEGFITEDFSFYLPTSWIYTFNPRYFKFFNSYEIPKQLPKAQNKPYIYSNYDYLIKYTSYKFYKKEQVLNALNHIKEKYYQNITKFYINDKLLFNLIKSNL